jgi:hypothetical protein
MHRKTLVPIVVTALTIDVGALLFFAAARRSPSNLPGVGALIVGAIVTVGALVMLIRRTVGREWAKMVAETNAALRSLAGRCGLDLLEPQAGSKVASPFDVCAEARGVFLGVRVRASVEPLSTDELTFSLRLQGGVTSAASFEALSPTADRVAVDERGVTLNLHRKRRFWRLSALTYDCLPETDVARLLSALESGCSALRPAATP